MEFKVRVTLNIKVMPLLTRVKVFSCKYSRKKIMILAHGHNSAK
jgi:hypothetical protein